MPEQDEDAAALRRLRAGLGAARERARQAQRTKVLDDLAAAVCDALDALIETMPKD